MAWGLRDNSPRPNARKGDKPAKPAKADKSARADKVDQAQALTRRERQRVEDKPAPKKEKPEVSRPAPKPAQSLLDTSVRSEMAEPVMDRKGVSAWNVRLSPSLVLMLSILLLVTLSFFFIFGLVIGRGTVPPTQPAALERLLPENELAADGLPEDILPAENLHFMSILREDGEQDTTLYMAGEGPAFGPSPYTGIQAGTGTYQADSPPPQLMRYDFVLQAAAFKVEEQADALRLRLEDAGMRTKLVREAAQSGTWYHVQVLYRGTEENFQALRDSLPSFGIRDSILASKTPVD